MEEVTGMDHKLEIMLNPEKYGYTECSHCNGYGSSLKDPEDVNICTRCHGTGLIKGQKEAISNDRKSRDLL